MKINVSNVNELYDAVNDNANIGATLVLAPGIYKLDENRPNKGRLELKENMELQGQLGHPEKVVIDASGLKDASFESAGGFPPRTGAIRIGKGKNVIEELTVRGSSAPKALSVIDSDLIGVGATHVIISHCIITGGRIGINFRNISVPGVNRSIEAEIMNNELTGNLISDAGTQQGQGIVFQNVNGASGATIKATMKNNNIHHNIIGMRIFNNNSNAQTDNTSLIIVSKNDMFDNNKLGIYITGALNRALNAPIDGNLIQFEAHGSSVRENKGIQQDIICMPCGIFVAGAISMLAGSQSSNNKVEIKLTGCDVSGNQDTDIIAFGEFSTVPGSAGVNNVVEIELQGVSKKARLTFPSQPPFPIDTNKVIVHE